MAEKSNRRVIEGVVTSNKMDKTVAVMIERKVKHPLYKKYLRRSTKFLAHDEKNECSIGDIVSIKEVKPVSKNKSFMVMKVVKKSAVGADVELKDGSGE